MRDFWKGRNVLVTGIGGFIGSAVGRRLIADGATVTGIVRTVNNFHVDLLERSNIMIGDVCDYTFMREVISSNHIDVIFHFAAMSIVRAAAFDPLTAYRVNVMGTANLLEAARNVGRCSSIVVASSDKAYGDHDVLPYTEEFRLDPRNTYDTSKACMDMLARSFAQNYDMPICVSRCSNVYGPGDHNVTRLIPNTIIRLLSGVPPVLYQDVATMVREFVYIDDVVEAYMRAAMSPDMMLGRAFNIGGAGPTLIQDLVEKITKRVGVDVRPVVVPRDNVFREIGEQYIDASFIEKKLGWVRKVPISEGLDRTIDWYRRWRSS